MSIPHWKTRLHRFDTRVYIGSTISMKWEVIMEYYSMTMELWMTLSRSIFLHWLEALSLMKSMPSSVSAIAKLVNLVTVSYSSPQLSDTDANSSRVCHKSLDFSIWSRMPIGLFCLTEVSLRIPLYKRIILHLSLAQSTA